MTAKKAIKPGTPRKGRGPKVSQRKVDYNGDNFGSSYTKNAAEGRTVGVCAMDDKYAPKSTTVKL